MICHFNKKQLLTYKNYYKMKKQLIKNLCERIHELAKQDFHCKYDQYYGYSIYQICDGAICDVFGLSSTKSYKYSEFIALLHGIIAGLVYAQKINH